MSIGGVLNVLAGLAMIVLAVALPMTGNYSSSKAIGMGVGLGVGGLTCLLVGIVLLKAGRGLAARKQLLATGQPGTAVIKSVRETGITIGRTTAILDFQLEVRPASGAPYAVSVRSPVPRIALGAVTPGRTVVVRVDPANQQQVAIDWSQAAG